jgi:ribose-phosphate pyrophosphokinase
MLLFTLPPHERLGATLTALGGFTAGTVVTGRFANGELHAAVSTNPAGHDCVLLGTVAPPDENLLVASLGLHTLRHQGARRVTALLPYLAYARHDKVEPGKSLGMAWLGASLGASGADEIVTVDVHSRRAQELSPVPVRSLSPAVLFASEIVTLTGRTTDLTIVAPDEGAIDRCEAVRQAAGIEAPVAYFAKTRGPGGIRHRALHGAVCRRAVLVDDILDTGSTLVSACQELRAMGVTPVAVMVTHALFTGTRWHALRSFGIETICCTDTTPVPVDIPRDRVRILGVAPLLVTALAPERQHA